ncbi:Sporulation domain protein [Magnetococcus marinus MC-1]|uniref:Sporulation domain protein n=1 Tax=Magnetococcus marinus (strain ATCC BAA-1437 / JCM 17883 / MC-1) TaxID=156889 RepID=A0LDD9_MAGMM|nr:SPOR domain-containing protein [Magnetococcus marinus]ABK45982.1 Sporulation domain protein [Magnetococcus marinus MC-1]
MSGAIRREQQFLINFGGLIMVLIVGMVVYEMFTGGGDIMLADLGSQRPVVQVTRPGGEGLKVNSAAASQPQSWLTSSQPARIFAAPPNKAPSKQEEPVDQVKEIKPPSELQASWNRPTSTLRADDMNLSPPQPSQSPAGTQSVSLMQDGQATGAQMPAPTVEPVVPAPPANKPAPLSLAPRKISEPATQTPVPVTVASTTTPIPVSQPLPVPVQPQYKAPIQPAYRMPAPINQTPALPSMRAIQPTPAPAAPAQAYQMPSQNVAQAAPTSGYSVQVSSFSDTIHANGLRQRLASLPFNGQYLPVYTTTAEVKGKLYYRVRLGPFPNREVANQARLYLQQRTGQSGQIVAPGR